MTDLDSSHHIEPHSGMQYVPKHGSMIQADSDLVPIRSYATFDRSKPHLNVSRSSVGKDHLVRAHDYRLGPSATSIMEKQH